jgi:macrolide-specific efflux system membrane fusion protein
MPARTSTPYLPVVTAVVVLVLLVLPVTPAAAQSGIVVPDCYVTLMDDVEVPAESQGVVMTFTAHDGMKVTKGDTLGNVDDRAARAQLELAEIELASSQDQASNDVRVRYARAEADVARAEYEAAKATNEQRPGAISLAEIRRLGLNVKRATLGIEQAQVEQKLLAYTVRGNAARVKVATDEVTRRQIRSPLDGVVVEVRRHVGEWVSPGDPVLRIVRMDRLRIEGFLNINEHHRQEVSRRSVVAKVDLGGGQTVTFQGKVTYVSPVIQAGGDYRIRAEVENREEGGEWLLQPGQRAELTIVN